jgi:hypothetical protein
MMGPTETWQALFYAALTVSILITTAAEQIAQRDMQKELSKLEHLEKKLDETQQL